MKHLVISTAIQRPLSWYGCSMSVACAGFVAGIVVIAFVFVGSACDQNHATTIFICIMAYFDIYYWVNKYVCECVCVSTWGSPRVGDTSRSLSYTYAFWQFFCSTLFLVFPVEVFRRKCNLQPQLVLWVIFICNAKTPRTTNLSFLWHLKINKLFGCFSFLFCFGWFVNNFIVGGSFWEKYKKLLRVLC